MISPSLKKSVRMFLALAIALPTLMGFIMPISSLSAPTNSVTLNTAMDCHQSAQDNETVTKQHCFLHCFSHSHQPTILTAQTSLVKDQDTAVRAAPALFVQYLTLTELAPLLAARPPPSQYRPLPHSSTIAALFERNHRLRI